MADTVDTDVVFQGTKLYVVRLTNRSDGTGESDVVKVDKSTLVNSLGQEPSKIGVEEIQWTIQGFTSVQLEWDHNTDDVIDILAFNGYRNYAEYSGLKDPSSAGGTGDILLTTFGNVAGATYDITLTLRLY